MEPASQHTFFALISRMRYIGRWGLMRNTRVENVSEHSHMVAILAHALAVLKNERFGGHVDPGEAAVAALYHDAPEILTGDLPTPVKYFNPDIQGAYKQVEAVAADQLLALLPEELRALYRPYVSETCDPEIHALVKAADKLSAYIKCVEELKAGNLEFREAARHHPRRTGTQSPAGSAVFYGGFPPRLLPHPGRAAARQPPRNWERSPEPCEPSSPSSEKTGVGIIASVCALLAEHKVNVLDISQTVMQEYFTMIMLVDASDVGVPFADLVTLLEQKGQDMNLSIRIQREDIFNAMHRI